MKDSSVVAVCCADLHLSHRAPVARSCEGDWLKIQAGYLQQLDKLCRRYECPLIIAGDLFDRWNPPSELVNLALSYLPDDCYAVPGNHDLSSGGMEDIKKTAFWTLVKAGKITLLRTDRPIDLASANPLRLHGFGHKDELHPLEDPQDFFIEVAVVHQYVWASDSKHQMAREEALIGKVLKNLTGYNAAIFGDNHLHFAWRPTPRDECQCHIWNCGAFMRRKSDEVELTPCIGLLHIDGSFTQHLLDVRKDKFLDPNELTTLIKDEHVEDFIQELSELQDVAIDFGERVRQAVKGVSPQIARLALKSLEGKP